MDTFQGCYKDGSNGTRDCRWFSAFYFILRIIYCIIFVLLGFTLFSRSLKQLLLQLFNVIWILVLVYLKPYKNSLYNSLDITILVDCIIISSLYTYGTSTSNSVVVVVCLFIALGLPLLGAVIFVTYHLIKRLRFFIMKAKIKFRYTGLNSGLSYVIDENYESQESNQLNSSLPDRLLHPHMYTEFKKQRDFAAIGSKYGSIGSPAP